MTTQNLTDADQDPFKNISPDGDRNLAEMTRWEDFLTRVLDISIGLVGTCGFLLLFPAIGFLIRLDSPGPILYRASRVGKGGRLFTMYKFRSMYVSTELVGASITPQGDPRVTEVGRWLRRTKLDELPQFLNILKGDMTLIGPRPEALDLAADYPDGAKQVFEAKPGLIGPNQIIGRNEEEWYPPGVDHRKYYLEEILPDKVANDLGISATQIFLGRPQTAGRGSVGHGVRSSRPPALHRQPHPDIHVRN